MEAALIDQACASIDSAPGVDVADWFTPSYEVTYDEFHRFNEGSYGYVYLGKWFNSKVVIKKVIPHSDENFRTTFEREATIWFKLSHPYVVKLFGACHVGEQLFFVCEYASHGQLDTYLHDDDGKRRNETWSKLYEAALGLRYLHSRGIVHHDLKCNNILVGRDGLAKLTDFGLSVEIKQSSDASQKNDNIGAPRWKAPEVLTGKGASFASDIFSFAMCIIEAVTGEFPWGNFPLDIAVKKCVKNGNLPERPIMFSDAQWQLVKDMCKFDPMQRLAINVVVERLKVFADDSVSS